MDVEKENEQSVIILNSIKDIELQGVENREKEKCIIIDRCV